MPSIATMSHASLIYIRQLRDDLEYDDFGPA